jgi:flagellar biosynthesis protein FliR
VISITEAQLTAWLAPVFWPFLRVLGMLGSAPVFSIRAIPVRTKVGLAFLVALSAQASLTGQPLVGLNDVNTLGAAVHELLIGLAIGFAVRLVFSSVELAGELMGLQMGLNFAMFFDPSSNGQVSAIGRFFGNMVILLFVAVNGHLLVLMAVIKSFEAFPVNHGILQTYSQLKLYQMGADLFATALWIALPLIGMLMLVNLTLGIVSRIAPQMNIYAIGFPVTLTVGLMGIAAGLPLLEAPMMALMERAIDLFAAR